MDFAGPIRLSPDKRAVGKRGRLMTIDFNRKWKWAAAVSFGCLATVPVQAQTSDNPSDFKRCDGFGAPNENGDGMTKMASGFLGLFRMATHAGDTSLSAPTFSEEGIVACESALKQQRLSPTYHLRRASLIRARGLHRLHLSQYKSMIADLDAADAEGRLAGSPYYDRSLGVGNKLFRAYALDKSGEKSAAVELLRQVRAQRPYTFQTLLSASIIELQSTHDWNAFLSQIEEMTLIHPRARQLYFYTAMDMGAFDKAVAIRPVIDSVVPKKWANGFMISNHESIRAEKFADDVNMDAAMAIALAAVGRTDEADSLLKAIEARLQTAQQDLPLGPKGRKPPRAERDTHDQILRSLPMLNINVARHRFAIELLALAKTGDKAKLEEALGRDRIPTAAWMPLLLRTLKANSKQGQGEEIATILAEIERRQDADRHVPEISMETLYNVIPGAETAERLPKYKGAKNIIGENTGNGFTHKKDGDVITVNFGGVTATASTVEEMALLKAAENARALGHTHIATLTSELSQRTLHTYSMYASGSSPMGYSVDLRYVSFGPSPPPAGYEAYAAKGIAVDKIINDLGPIYKNAKGDVK